MANAPLVGNDAQEIVSLLEQWDDMRASLRRALDTGNHNAVSAWLVRGCSIDELEDVMAEVAEREEDQGYSRVSDPTDCDYGY